MIQIGTKFRKVGRKNQQVWTVTDVLRTYNLAGDLVKTCYVAKSECCLYVPDTDVCETTILKGMVCD